MGKKKRAFVISPIGSEGSEVRKEADSVFKYIIKPALEACGVEGQRADQVSKTGRISDQMFSAILQGDFCIALLTGHNPNVFYELAIAQAAGKPVVMMIKKGERLPFDVANWRCIKYDLELGPIEDGIYKNEMIKYIESIREEDWKAESLLKPYGVKIGGPAKVPTVQTVPNKERISYLLRGIKETYRRHIAEKSRKARPPNIQARLNIMVPERESTGKDPSLRIAVADYWIDYQDEEKYEKWHAGEGKAGVAWEKGRPQYYAPDIGRPEAHFEEMGKKTDIVFEIKSVLSTPITWKGRPIAILNMDSYQGGKATCVDQFWVHDVFKEGAREIAFLLVNP